MLAINNLARGAVGLNASTSQDQTRYFCSLPSNKLELWFALESERFRCVHAKPQLHRNASGVSTKLHEAAETGQTSEQVHESAFDFIALCCIPSAAAPHCHSSAAVPRSLTAIHLPLFLAALLKSFAA
eukprot:scaffold236671_cov17-Tisochrysis_lutea.AAC.1